MDDVANAALRHFWHCFNLVDPDGTTHLVSTWENLENTATAASRVLSGTSVRCGSTACARPQAVTMDSYGVTAPKLPHSFTGRKRGMVSGSGWASRTTTWRPTVPGKSTLRCWTPPAFRPPPGSRWVDFLEPVGRHRVYYVPHPETTSLVRSFPQLTFCATRVSWRDEIMEDVRVLNKYGLLDDAEVAGAGAGGMTIREAVRDRIWEVRGGRA